MKRVHAVAAFVFTSIFAFTLSIQAQQSGNVGTSQCGGVQQAVQKIVGDEDPKVYRNHGAYVSAVSTLVDQASQSGLITGGCSDCIVNQFARSVSVANQTHCGPVTPPTQSCSQTNPPPQQIQTATVLSLQTVTDPWDNVSQFQSVLNLTNIILGCQLQDAPPQSVSPQSVQPQVQDPQCATPGVNYCGPGNSRTDRLLTAINVPACLNEACCEHDSCYGVNCVASECDFSPQSQTCDNPLVATCEGNGSCTLSTILTSPTALFVCTIVECLNGTFPDPRCTALRLTRFVATPECNQPSSLQTCNLQCAGQTCATFTTCNPGSGCVDPVCGSIAEGGGLCVEGTTSCAGLAGCTTSADCGGGLCFVESCCGRPVCVTSAAFCPDIGGSSSTPRTLTPSTVEGPTIGHP